MIDKLNENIKQLLLQQNEMDIEFEDDEKIIIKGNYFYTLKKDSFYTSGKINIKINIPRNYPLGIPNIYILDKLPKDISHINQDGTACVASYFEIVEFLKIKPSIQEYLNIFLNSFIVTVRYFEKYNKYIFGEREHGYKGILSSFKDSGINTKKKIRKYLKIIETKKYRPNTRCICDSKNKFNDCHGATLEFIITNENIRKLFLLNNLQ